MIKDLGAFMIGLAVGIRYRANFSVEDKLGEILDTILYSKGSFFNPSIFPRVINQINDKTLINEVNADSLRINNSNIILEIQFGKNFDKKDSETILDNFHAQIVLGIMKKYEIKEIIRVGYVRRYLLDITGLAGMFVDKTIGKTLGGVNDINLRFSKKFPTEKALIKEKVHDYRNVVFNTIKKADKDEIFMSVDYQKYFDPPLESATQIKFPEFVKDANSFNQGGYLTWLNTNYVEGHRD